MMKLKDLLGSRVLVPALATASFFCSCKTATANNGGAQNEPPAPTWTDRRNGYQDDVQVRALSEQVEKLRGFQQDELGRLLQDSPSLYAMLQALVERYNSWSPTDPPMIEPIHFSDPLVRAAIADGFRRDLEARGVHINYDWDSDINLEDYLTLDPAALMFELGKDALFSDLRTPGERISSAQNEQGGRVARSEAQALSERLMCLYGETTVLRDYLDSQFFPVVRSDVYRDYAVPGAPASRVSSIYERRAFEERWQTELQNVKSMRDELQIIRKRLDDFDHPAQENTEYTILKARADEIEQEVDRASARFVDSYSDKFSQHVLSMMRPQAHPGQQGRSLGEMQEVLNAIAWVDVGAQLLSRLDSRHAEAFSKISKTAIAMHGLVSSSQLVGSNPYLAAANFALKIFSIFFGSDSDIARLQYLSLMNNIDQLRKDLFSSTDFILASLHYMRIENRRGFDEIRDLLVKDIHPRLVDLQRGIQEASIKFDNLGQVVLETRDRALIAYRIDDRDKRGQLMKPVRRPQSNIQELITYACEDTKDPRLTGGSWVGESDIGTDIQGRLIAHNLVYIATEFEGRFDGATGYIAELVRAALPSPLGMGTGRDLVARNSAEYLFALNRILAILAEKPEFLDRALPLGELLGAADDIVEMQEFLASHDVLASLVDKVSSEIAILQDEVRLRLDDPAMRSRFGISPLLDMKRPIEQLCGGPTALGKELSRVRVTPMVIQDNPWQDTVTLIADEDRALIYDSARAWKDGRVAVWMPQARADKLRIPTQYFGGSNNTGDHDTIDTLTRSLPSVSFGRLGFNPLMRALAFNQDTATSSTLPAAKDLALAATLRILFVSQGVHAETRPLHLRNETRSRKRGGSVKEGDAYFEDETIPIIEKFRHISIDAQPEIHVDISAPGLLRLPDGGVGPSALHVVVTPAGRILMGEFWREEWAGIWDFKSRNRVDPKPWAIEMANRIPDDTLPFNLLQAQTSTVQTVVPRLGDIAHGILPLIEREAQRHPQQINFDTDWLSRLMITIVPSEVPGQISVSVSATIKHGMAARLKAHAQWRAIGLPLAERLKRGAAINDQSSELNFVADPETSAALAREVEGFTGTVLIGTCDDSSWAVEQLLACEGYMLRAQSKYIQGPNAGSGDGGVAGVSLRSPDTIVGAAVAESSTLHQRLESLTGVSQLLYATMMEAAPEVLEDVMARPDRDREVLRLIYFDRLEPADLRGMHRIAELIDRWAPFGSAHVLNVIEERLRLGQGELQRVVAEFESELRGAARTDRLGTQEFRESLGKLRKLVDVGH